MSIALVINCNYKNLPQFSLSGCHNDGDNFISTIRQIEPNINIILLRDNLSTNSRLYPNKINILRELNNLVNSNFNKLYFYFSGHGTTTNDFNKDEITINNPQIINLQSLKKDSCLVSNDISRLNIITDDEIYNVLIKTKPSQKLYSFIDCCYSGTIFDLPWVNMINYLTSFKSKNLLNLKNEVEKNSTYNNGNYPNKLNKIPSNIILISGTRDNKFSYEFSGTKPGGIFTSVLCWLLRLNISKLSLKDLYMLITGIINLRQQIPVISSSREINLNLILNDFNITNISPINLNNNILIPPIRTMNRDYIDIDISEIIWDQLLSLRKLAYFNYKKSEQKNRIINN